MEMLSPDAELILTATDGQLRTLKRVEYELLAARGFFENERVELLFGMVVPMSPADPAHGESVTRVYELLLKQLGERARVFCQSAFAASEDSQPEPDVYAVPEGSYWTAHPQRSFLVIEVSRSSLKRDRAKSAVYGRGDVDEYWIVNQLDGCIEVYRDRVDGTWQHASIHRRGETVSPVTFPDVVIAVDAILPPAE